MCSSDLASIILELTRSRLKVFLVLFLALTNLILSFSMYNYLPEMFETTPTKLDTDVNGFLSEKLRHDALISTDNYHWGWWITYYSNFTTTHVLLNNNESTYFFDSPAPECISKLCSGRWAIYQRTGEYPNYNWTGILLKEWTN